MESIFNFLLFLDASCIDPGKIELQEQPPPPQ